MPGEVRRAGIIPCDQCVGKLFCHNCIWEGGAEGPCDRADHHPTWRKSLLELQSGLDIHLCEDCIANNPYKGQLSLASGSGGELTICCPGGSLEEI